MVPNHGYTPGTPTPSFNFVVAARRSRSAPDKETRPAVDASRVSLSGTVLRSGDSVPGADSNPQ
jgi:hypothetical protein